MFPYKNADNEASNTVIKTVIMQTLKNILGLSYGVLAFH